MRARVRTKAQLVEALGVEGLLQGHAGPLQPLHRATDAVLGLLVHHLVREVHIRAVHHLGQHQIPYGVLDFGCLQVPELGAKVLP